MKKIVVLLAALLLTSGYLFAAELEYFQVYTPKDGMSADEIMQIKYFNKYALFAHDVSYTGRAYFIDKSGDTRERSTARKRINLGRKSDGIAYKDLTIFTGPTQVKGLGNLSWTYLDPKKEQDAWIWLPSLKKIRKISASQADDSFLGADFTVEDISTRRFDDETYKLVKEENFSGYTSDFSKKTYYKDEPCFVIEATPKRANWYYAKRLIWVNKKYGDNIYEEKYDAKGEKFQTIFRSYEVYTVNGKEYALQMFLEGKDLRSGHQTVIINDTVKIDQGLSEEEFTEGALGRSRW
ncbi:MAG TPA: outer membrane lipoprotein-sorting protein [Candidatus Margulisiibacteriota bacterium]|nr:outer membrane lipoprotein-sorting protein [Candidatus Margulisiibacteriota bacterium]